MGVRIRLDRYGLSAELICFLPVLAVPTGLFLM